MNDQLQAEPKFLFTVTENGLDFKSNKVVIPACKIKALSYLDAVDKLNQYLDSQVEDPDIQLITPIHRIEFPSKFNKVNKNK